MVKLPSSNVEYPFIIIPLGSTQTGEAVLIRAQSMNQIEILNRFQYLKPFNCVQTTELRLV